MRDPALRQGYLGSSKSGRTSLIRSVMVLGVLPSAGVNVVMSSNISFPYLQSWSHS